MNIRRISLCTACLVGSVSAALWFSGSMWGRFFASKAFRYVDSGFPMLVEGDAYYHLHHATLALAGHDGAPLLSQLGAVMTRISGLPLPVVAFWLPMVLAALTGLCVWGWGRLLALRPWQGFLASALTVLMPAFAVRVAPGRFDTDGGIALLWHLSILCVAYLNVFSGCNSKSTNIKKPWLAAIGLLVAGGGLGLFWTPGFVLLPLCLWLWSVSGLWEPCPAYRRVRLTCALLLPLLGLVVLVLPDAFLPGTVSHMRAYALDHLQLASGMTGRQMGISELRTLSPRTFLAMLGAYPAAGMLTLFALALAVWRFPRLMLFFLPSGLALMAGFFSARFLYLAALPLALGVALLPETLPWAMHKIGQRPASCRLSVAGGAVAVLLAGCSFFWPLLQAPPPVYNANLDSMVLSLKQQAKPDAKLWNWWDEGYFLQARTGLVPLFHGGSQTDDAVRLAAYPLVNANPLVARRWMRFFARHGLGTASTLHAAWGSWEAVGRNLTQVFAADDPVRVAAALPVVPGFPLNSADRVLPAGQVMLFLPSTFLLFGATWEHAERLAVPDAPTLRLISTPKKAFQGTVVEGQPAVIDTGDGPVSVKNVINTSRTPLTAARLLSMTPPYLITHDASPWWHLASQQAAQSVMFRLLAPWGAPVTGFRQVWFHPAVGGVWEVLP